MTLSLYIALALSLKTLFDNLDTLEAQHIVSIEYSEKREREQLKECSLEILVLPTKKDE